MTRIVIVAALALAAPAAAQQAVYTNVVNGRPQAEIVRVVRPLQPAAPVPASIATTPVLPRNWRPPLGPTGYVPPAQAAASPEPHTYRRPEPPWFVNGIYMGPSPFGGWTTTVVGRPIVDVHVVSTPPPVRPR